MATYIKTESSGALSYEIQPDEKQILPPNIKDVYPAAELALIENEISDINDTIAANDVSNVITFTPDENTTFTLKKAVQIGNVAFIQCIVTPKITLSTAGALNVGLEGITPALDNDSRVGVGLVGPADIFFSWLLKSENTTTLKFKKFVNSTWPEDTAVDFTLIIPVGD